MIEKVLPAEAARGSRSKDQGSSPEGSGSGSGPDTLNPEPCSASSASSDRVRRYPISFQRAGELWVAAQTALFSLEPMRLVVCEPSEGAVLRLNCGEGEWLFRNWTLAKGEAVHARELSWARFPLLWRPGTLATIELLSGAIAGAAFVTKKAGTE